MSETLPVIPHSRPTVGDEEARAVAAVIGSGQLAQGPAVQAFEAAAAGLAGRRDGVAVASGTAALELALLALGVGPGDEVILPSYVCTAPWLAVTRVGATPRLADIEPATYSLDPGSARKALSSRSRALIVPHLFGLPADLTALTALGLPVIEDCAQTLGASENGRVVGSVGRATVCSFYATKLLCTGEGGMLLANDAALLSRARALRDYDAVPALEPAAYNRKMTDLQAAMGVSQISRFKDFLARRAAIAAAYTAALQPLGLSPPVVPSGRSHVYYRYVTRLARPRPSLDEVLAGLEKEGVQARRPVFRPLHHYLALSGFPASDEAQAQALSLPIYPGLTDEQVRRVTAALAKVLG